MVFSGVIPVSGAPADPRTHRLWMMAESHGAAVERDIGRHTTHVVAARLGTAKVLLYLTNGTRDFFFYYCSGRQSGYNRGKQNTLFLFGACLHTYKGLHEIQ